MQARDHDRGSRERAAGHNAHAYGDGRDDDRTPGHLLAGYFVRRGGGGGGARAGNFGGPGRGVFFFFFVGG